jgi:flagellar assembly protein FliH
MESIIRAAALAPTTLQLRRTVVRVDSGSTTPTERGRATPNPTPHHPAGRTAAPAAEEVMAEENKISQSDCTALYQAELTRLAEEQQQQQSSWQLQLQKQREAELQQAKAAAEQLGYAEGLARGQQQAGQQWQEQAGKLAALFGQIEAGRNTLLAQAEEAMVELAFTALCRIIGDAAGQKTLVQAMVQQLLSETRGHEALVLTLHPQDLELVKSALPELGIDPRQTRLAADPAMKIGGVLLETSAGTLDARLDTQLTRLREALLQARQGDDPAPGYGHPSALPTAGATP